MSNDFQMKIETKKENIKKKGTCVVYVYSKVKSEETMGLTKEDIELLHQANIIKDTMVGNRNIGLVLVNAENTVHKLTTLINNIGLYAKEDLGDNDSDGILNHKRGVIVTTYKALEKEFKKNKFSFLDTIFHLDFNEFRVETKEIVLTILENCNAKDFPLLLYRTNKNNTSRIREQHKEYIKSFGLKSISYSLFIELKYLANNLF